MHATPRFDLGRTPAARKPRESRIFHGRSRDDCEPAAGERTVGCNPLRRLIPVDPGEKSRHVRQIGREGKQPTQIFNEARPVAGAQDRLSRMIDVPTPAHRSNQPTSGKCDQSTLPTCPTLPSRKHRQYATKQGCLPTWPTWPSKFAKSVTRPLPTIPRPTGGGNRPCESTLMIRPCDRQHLPGRAIQEC